VWGVLVVGITETLSAFSALTRLNLAVVWLAVILIALARASRVRRAIRDFRRPKIGIVPSVYLAAMAVIVLITAYLAVAAAPSAWDALSYHLPRVAHWAERRSVSNYPTNITRQLWLSPGAEFITLHLQLLTGNDTLSNIPQWLAFVGCAIVGSYVALLLGAGPTGQLATALVSLTTPMAIVQASGAQVDLVASFWLLCLIALALETMESGRRTTLRHALMIGGAAGLAILTKTTALLFGFPFAVWYVIVLFKRGGKASWLIPVVTAGVAVGVNFGFLARNTGLYGNPLGPGLEAGVVNGIVSPGAILSNVLRNGALQLGTHFPPADTVIFRAVQSLHGPLGIDLNDRRTTVQGTRFTPVHMSFNEGNAGSPLHAVLALIVGVTLIARRPTRWRNAQYFAIAVATGYLLFCAYLRWEPWNPRLLLPVLLMSAPLIGYGLDTYSSLPLVYGTSVILFVFALMPLLLNPARPIIRHRPIWSIPREKQYFADMGAWYEPYRSAVESVAATGCRRVGIHLGENDWEHPIWVMLRNRLRDGVEIRHVAVPNQSAATASESDKAFVPCAVISINTATAFTPNGSIAVQWTLSTR